MYEVTICDSRHFEPALMASGRRRWSWCVGSPARVPGVILLQELTVHVEVSKPNAVRIVTALGWSPSCCYNCRGRWRRRPGTPVPLGESLSMALRLLVLETRPYRRYCLRCWQPLIWVLQLLALYDTMVKFRHLSVRLVMKLFVNSVVINCYTYGFCGFLWKNDSQLT